MKLAIAVWAIVAIMIFALQGLGSIENQVFTTPLHPISSSSDPKDLNAKVMDELKNAKQITTNNDPTNDTLVNSTLINSTLINNTLMNNTLVNETLLSNSTSSLTSSVFAGKEGVGDNTKNAFNGYWSMQAEKQSFGKNVKSNTFLSGNFDVDKTVKFSE